MSDETIRVVYDISAKGFKEVRDLVEGLRKGLNDAGFDVGEVESRMGALEKTVHKVSRALDGIKGSAAGAGSAGKKAGEEASSAWQAVQKRIAEANAEHRKYQRGLVTGEGGGKSFGGLGKGELRDMVHAKNAQNADVLKDFERSQAREVAAAKKAEAEKVAAAKKAADQRIAEEKRVAAEAEKANKAQSSQIDSSLKLAGKGGASGQSFLDDKAFRDKRSSNKAAMAEWDTAFKDATVSAKEFSSANEGIISQRYAMYDMARTYTAIGLALAGASTYAVVVGAQFEAAFTSVERTLDSSIAPEAIENIRQSLVSLSGQIPLTFRELAGIATIGNQMGIVADELVGFTETVAQFASVSGMSIDSVTQAFGGFAAQTGLQTEHFVNLGSSIALAGRLSNATEAQIVSLVRELAAGANSAGFAAHEIVGLATAMGSFQVAPERARGVMDTFFGRLNQALAEGGSRMEEFARLAGMTGQELDSMVKSGEGAKVFEAVLQGLKAASPNTVELTKNLDLLGLSGLRAGNTFTRFMNNLDVATNSMENAKKGFQEGAELQEQYAMTLDDLSTQWSLFINNINAVIEAVTGGAIPGLAALLQMVSSLITGFREWLGDNQWAASIMRMVMIAGALVGGLALVKGASLAARASMLAFATMNAAAARGGIGSVGVFRAMSMALFGVGNGARSAAGGLRLLRGALISTGIGALAVGAGLLLEHLMPIGPELKDNSVNLSDFSKASYQAGTAAEDTGKKLGGMGGAASKATEKVRTLVDYANDLAGVFKRSSDLRFGSGAAMDEITLKWIELNEQAEAYLVTIRGLTADRELKAYWLSIADLYDDQIRASQLREDIAKIDDEMARAQAGASTELEGGSKAAIENRKEMRALIADYESYVTALAAAGATQSEIQAILSGLNGDFMSQATALGFAGAELDTYSVRFADMAKIVDAIPRNITVNFNADPALLALAEFAAKAKDDMGGGGGGGGGGGLGGDLADIVADDFADQMRARDASFAMAVMDRFGQFDQFKAGLGPTPGNRYKDAAKQVATDVSTAIGDQLLAGGNPFEALGSLIERDKPKLAKLAADSGILFTSDFTGGMGSNLAMMGTNPIAAWMGEETPRLTTVFDVAGQMNSAEYNKSLLGGLRIAGSVAEVMNAEESNIRARFGRLGYNSGATFTNDFSRALQALGRDLGNMTGGIVSQIRGAASGGRGFAGGGFTGRGHWLTPAGVVHRGEHVIPKKHVNQSTGLPNPDYVASLHKGKSGSVPGYAGGGFVGGGGSFPNSMELGPMSLHQIVNALKVSLGVDGRELARAASKGDADLAWAGSN